MRHIRGIVFDLDGVLIDSRENCRQAFLAACRGLDRDAEALFARYRACFGMKLSDILEEIGLPPFIEEGFIAESVKLLDTVTLYPGTATVLTSLRRRGYRLGIATGKEMMRTEMILERLGLRKCFASVLASDRVEKGKPHPEILQRSMCNLQLGQDELVFVGDSPNDIATGRNAGVVTCAALWGESEPEELHRAGPDHLLESLGSLEALLDLDAGGV